MTALVLAGAWNASLHDAIAGLAPNLDQVSGDLIHWILPGDPRRTRGNGLAYLKSIGFDLELLHGDSPVPMRERADERDVIAEVTEDLRRHFKLQLEDLPSIVFRFSESGEVMPLSLRKLLDRPGVSLRTTIEGLLGRLEPKAIDPSGKRNPYAVQLAVKAATRALLVERTAPKRAQAVALALEDRVNAVLVRVFAGEPVHPVCEELNVVPSTFYRRKRAEVKHLREAQRASKRAAPRGSKSEGLIEAVAPDESDESDR